LGPGIFGVEAAAQEYFGVPAARLTQVQAASLAATLPQPLTSNPRYRPVQMAWRRDLILRRLRGQDTSLEPLPDAPPPLLLPRSRPCSRAKGWSVAGGSGRVSTRPRIPPTRASRGGARWSGPARAPRWSRSRGCSRCAAARRDGRR